MNIDNEEIYNEVNEELYSEAIMQGLALLGESEQLEKLSSLPKHLREKALRKEVKKMTKALKEMKSSLNKLTTEFKNPDFQKKNEKDIKIVSGKLSDLNSRVDECLKTLTNSYFVAWFNKPENNKRLFGLL